MQCQFSLGCALNCSLYFLHEGATQAWLNFLLAAALSWFLASQCSRLWHHVKTMYPIHSTQRYCGVCIGLLTSGTSILPFLCSALILTFCVAGFAAISSINQHFLSTTEALRFWTPLTICYTLLVVYMHGETWGLPLYLSGNLANSPHLTTYMCIIKYITQIDTCNTRGANFKKCMCTLQ